MGKTLCAAMAAVCLCAYGQSQPVPGPNGHQHKTEYSQPESGHADPMAKLVATVEPPPHNFSTNNPYKEQEPSGVSRVTSAIWEWLVRLFHDPIALFTLTLAIYTVRLWSATKRLADGAESTAERQLRAYVFVSHEGTLGTDEKTGAFFATLAIQNCGQTPATELHCAVFMSMARLPLKIELDPPDHSGGSRSPLAPGGEGLKQFPQTKRPLTDAEKRAIQTGERALFVWGEVLYFDVFKQERRTWFRMYCTGDDLERGHLAYHQDGNGYT